MNIIKAHKKRVLTMLGMGMAMLLLIACSAQTPGPTGNAEASGSQPNATAAPVSNSVSNTSGDASAQRNTVSVVPSAASHDGQMTGISVSGQGQARGTPDIATVTLGVEASRDTVQAARDDAASAMANIIDVLQEQGVLERDIQTSFFSINPRYDREGREITGFVVSNQVTARIRNLDRVGAIIDQSTQAGGD